MLSQIDPPELARRMKMSPAPVLIDVRLDEDYLTEHLPDAMNNCVYEVSFSERMSEVAPRRDVAVCVYGAAADSHEARMAAEKLSRAGYGEVLELRVGLEGWKSAGLEVKTESQAAAKPSNPAPLDDWSEIDLTESKVEWVGRNLLNKHNGQIGIKNGKLHFVRGALDRGEVTLDMRAIVCHDLAGDPLHDVLITHLQSDDFFDTELYPEANFAITLTEAIPQATPGAPNLKVHGELTLKNVARPMEFLATTGMTPEGKAAAQASLAIDRTLWKVLYGSGKFFRNLGGHLVNDMIELQLRIVTR
jgi:rhodanese-related sulfurtransferase/polyisoprenoid-binding protein YceI